MRPSLTLVPGCGSRLRKSGLPRFAGVEIGAQLVPRDAPSGCGLNAQNLLRPNAALLGKPLPNHSLSNPQSDGKFGLGDLVSLEVGGQVHGPILATLVRNVNSKLLDSRVRARQGQDMAPGKRPKPGEGVPKEIMVAEGKALGLLWRTRALRTQEQFAEDQGYTQGNFSHFIGGRRPITLELAIAATKELGCKISDFSERLAKEQAKIEAQKLAPWPFSKITPGMIGGLSEGKIMQIEGAMLDTLQRLTEQTPEAEEPKPAAKGRNRR
jgi:hypothetical protein